VCVFKMCCLELWILLYILLLIIKYIYIYISAETLKQLEKLCNVALV